MRVEAPVYASGGVDPLQGISHVKFATATTSGGLRTFKVASGGYVHTTGEVTGWALRAFHTQSVSINAKLQMLVA